MKSTMDKLRERALSLSIGERASLAHDLILSLDHQNDLFFDEEYEGEIKRRVLMVKEGKTKGESADNVFSEIERRYEK